MVEYPRTEAVKENSNFYQPEAPLMKPTNRYSKILKRHQNDFLSEQVLAPQNWGVLQKELRKGF